MHPLESIDMPRYAAHLGSPSATAAFNSLLKAEVFVSDCISKSVSIDQDGRSIKVPGETANLHIAIQDETLRLYVPKSKKRQQLCLSRELPVTLLKHLGAQNLRSAAELGNIITTRSLFVVDALLDQAGIIKIDGITRPVDDDGYESSSSESESAASSIPRTPGSLLSPGYFSLGRTSRPSGNEDPFWTPATSVSSRGTPSPERLDLYKELLDAVIRQAEALSNLPNAGGYIVAPGLGTMTVNTFAAVASSFPGEKEFKIGAAGELFVSKIISVSRRFRLLISHRRTNC
jgi:hypothetical protein